MEERKPIEKKVDESWKETVERERKLGPPPSSKSQPARAQSAGSAAPAQAAAPEAARPAPEAAPAREVAPEPQREHPAETESHFMVFLSSLSMQAMMALGELPIPGTNHRQEDLEQARYLIDTMGLLQEKTKGNLTLEEGQFLENVLYELRIRYTQKITPPIPPPPGARR